MAGEYTVAAVRRVAQICSLFDARHSRWTVSEISRASGIPKRTLPRIISMLIARNLLEEGPDGAFSLGPAWLHLARLKTERLDLRTISRGVFERLRRSLDETYIIGVRRGDRRVISECLVSTQSIRRVSHVGFEASLHVGSAGRVILAGLTDDEIRDYLSRVALVNEGFDTLTDPERLWAEIRRARNDGFLTAKAEVTSESFSCSAPVRDITGAVIASITITLPLSRLDAGLEARAIDTVRRGAHEIERGIGRHAG